jgi:hypothetical protein
VVPSPPIFVHPEVVVQEEIAHVHTSASVAVLPRPTKRLVPSEASAVTCSYVLDAQDCPPDPVASPPILAHVLPLYFQTSASPAVSPRPTKRFVPSVVIETICSYCVAGVALPSVQLELIPLPPITLQALPFHFQTSASPTVLPRPT